MTKTKKKIITGFGVVALLAGVFGGYYGIGASSKAQACTSGKCASASSCGSGSGTCKSVSCSNGSLCCSYTGEQHADDCANGSCSCD